MAKFVLAGKADCPFYAKAELLADRLQGSLPDFRIHKISILPDEWKKWLEATCKRNGWEHKDSPLIWRELVARGGKGMLLGGFSDFLEYCQDFYSITSDMPTNAMLSVAAENLESEMSLIAEERRRVGLIRPLHVWISGALSTTCHFLIPNLLSAEVFPDDSAISLHLLDSDGSEEELQRLRMETEGLALRQLHRVSVHTGVERAFRDAHVILLLDEDEEEDQRKKVKRISDRCREYGRLIGARASEEVKVLVSADSFANLRCSLLADHARPAHRHRFVAVATQLENEARAILAKKLKVRPSDVTNVITWGNISGSFYIDLQRATVFNYDGPVKGPASFSQPVLKILKERKWLQTEFQDLVGRQRRAKASNPHRGAAMSRANAVLSVLKAWNGVSASDEVFSIGGACRGCYDLPDGIVFSIPVTFGGGKWAALRDVTIGDELKGRMQVIAEELRQLFCLYLRKEMQLGSEHRGTDLDTEEQS